MSQSLSRAQAVALGLVVVVALALGGYGVARIADKQGLWAETTEITAGFPEAHDVAPGTPVRIRGVDAGQVIAVEYPDHDGPGAEVTVRMRIQSKYASRIYADAAAKIHDTGLLGSKVISIQPGDPRKGALADGRVRGVKPFAMEEAVAEVRELAKEAKGTAAEVKVLAKETRETVAAAKGFIDGVNQSNGTLAKLIRDDDLYEEMRTLVARADRTVGVVEKEMTGLRVLVADGRDTFRSVRQSGDALGKMPIVRNYVENSAALLVRPTMTREKWAFESKYLFEPGTATLTGEGQQHMNNMANFLKANTNPAAEVVVAAYFEPNDRTVTDEASRELTRKQAEVIVAHLKACGVHKLGVVTRRKVTPLGMGANLSPADPEPNGPSQVQVLLFEPR